MVIRHIPLPLEDLPEPCQLLLLPLPGHLDSVRGLFVFPVRRNTVLSRAVHFKCTDLDLEWRPTRADHRRMERLVHVGLWYRDIILEPARHRCVHVMDQTKRTVALRYSVNDDTDCKKIIDLVNRLVLVDHLFIDGKIVLDASLDLVVLYAHFLKSAPALQYNIIDELLALGLSGVHLLYKCKIDIRLEISERKVIHLGLDLGNTETAGDR